MRRSSAGRLFHTDGPETENARRHNEVRVRTVIAASSWISCSKADQTGDGQR